MKGLLAWLRGPSSSWWLHTTLACAWAASVWPAETIWVTSLRFVNFASVYAVVIAHLASANAARARQAVDDLEVEG